jgi:hypothetical protein
MRFEESIRYTGRREEDLGDERLGMLLEVIPKVLRFQSDLLHLAHGAALHNEAIAFRIKEKCVGCPALRDAILNLLLKGSDLRERGQEGGEGGSSRGIGVLDSINFSNLMEDRGAVFGELDASVEVHQDGIGPVTEGGGG